MYLGYTDILINDTGIYVLKNESAQVQYVGTIITKGVPHFNGTAVVFYVDGEAEAVCLLGKSNCSDTRMVKAHSKTVTWKKCYFDVIKASLAKYFIYAEYFKL